MKKTLDRNRFRGRFAADVRRQPGRARPNRPAPVSTATTATPNRPKTKKHVKKTSKKTATKNDAATAPVAK